VSELLRHDAGDEVVEQQDLLRAAHIERLEHVVVQRAYLAEAASEQLRRVHGGEGVGVDVLRQINL